LEIICSNNIIIDKCNLMNKINENLKPELKFDEIIIKFLYLILILSINHYNKSLIK